MARLARQREFGPSVGLIGVVLIAQLSTGHFFSSQSLTGLTTIADTVAIVAIGVTLLMISGEFDLSVGQVYAFVPIIWSTLFVVHKWDPWLALIVALGAAVLVGLVNGWVVTKFGIPSFIVTLGMYFVIQGTNNLLIGGHQLVAFDFKHPTLTAFGARIGHTPFSAGIIWLMGLTFLGWYALEKTRYGNWNFATGGGVGPAKAMGVPVARVKKANFVVCSVLAGISGCIQFAYLKGVSQAQGDKYELLAITAAVLGGTSLFGGSGTVVGSVIGAFLLASIEVGLVLMGAPGSFYITFIGVVLVLVVILNVKLGRLTTSGRR
ncbi:MAG: ABC transporter permease [Actinomycetes bacterium]